MNLNLSDNAIKILEKRYLDPGETPYDRYLSMVKQIATAENKSERKQWEEKFMEFVASQKILPNSPTIMNYGKLTRQQQGSACFVLPIKDDLNDIFDVIRRAALIHKSGGGTGYNFSSLRPNGAIVMTTGKCSSGVIPFLTAFDSATGAVSQGGSRRGANMGILNVNHPDIIPFVTCKQDTDKIKNFNLSVGVTEEFFKAVENDSDWELYFIGEDGKRIQFYPNGDENNSLVTEVVIKARDLFNIIVENAHKNGEPGIIFIDRLQHANSVPGIQIIATNPCGEQPLPPDNSCVLASINLANHILDDWKDINYYELDRTVEIGVRLLDDIVTVNEYPIEDIKRNHDLQRRIGLGITGLADVLIMMGIPYGSLSGRKKAGEIMKFVNDRSHYWSFMLGKEKGSFPLFRDSIYNLNGQYRDQAISFYSEFLSSEELDELIESGLDGYMRNAATTTIAPTGTLTSLLGCEGYGCEPLFAIGYWRYILNGEKLPYVSALFEKIAKMNGFYSKELVEKAAEGGSAQLKEIPDLWREVFKTANEISVEDHLGMQAELQKYCDSGISKTINMSSDATINDVKDAYFIAYESGVIKGLTVYRDKSRDGAPISIGTKEEKDEVVSNETPEMDKLVSKRVMKKLTPIGRPKQTKGSTTQYNTGCGKMYLTVNHDDKSIMETFAFVGSSGGCSGLTEGLSRVTSLTIRLVRSFAEELNLDVEQITDDALNAIIDQLKSVRCNVALRNKKSEGKSCPDIIGRALESELKNLKNESKQVMVQDTSNDDSCDTGCSSCANSAYCKGETLGDFNEEVITTIQNEMWTTCPECGGRLGKSEGCNICIDCGFSKCH